MTPLAGQAHEDPDWRLQLATEGVWDLLGSSFGIACTSAVLGRQVDELLHAFPPGATPPPARRFVVVEGCERHSRDDCIHAGGAAVVAPEQPTTVLAWLLTVLNKAAIDAFGGLAVHAGVLSSAGRAVAVPAPSGAGKTTLTAAGLLAGFDYVSDEALAVDFASQQIVAYPRALALSPWSRRAVGLEGAGQIDVGPDEAAFAPRRLGARVAVPPLELSHVVRLVRRPGPATLVPIERAETVTLLMERSFNHYKRPGPSYELVVALARRCRAWRLGCDDPLEAAALIRERLGP